MEGISLLMSHLVNSGSSLSQKNVCVSPYESPSVSFSSKGHVDDCFECRLTIIIAIEDRRLSYTLMINCYKNVVVNKCLSKLKELIPTSLLDTVSTAANELTRLRNNSTL